MLAVRLRDVAIGRWRGLRGLIALGVLGLAATPGCETRSDPDLPEQSAEPVAKGSGAKSIEERSERSDEPPPAIPVPLWESGESTRVVDAAEASQHGHVILDLGESWVPYLFTNGVDPEGKQLPNAYRETYLALARGEFPDDLHGERARHDKYLELYGIMPTLDLMRKRFRRTVDRPCVSELDLQPLLEFRGLVVHHSNTAAKKAARDYRYLRGQVDRMLKKQKVETFDAIDPARLNRRERDRLRRFEKVAADYHAVDATQKRLKCEGYFKGRGRHVRGALDWSTRDALAEFERRHRIYSWGYLGKDTLAVLRLTPAEAERQAVLRVLTERAIHAAGVLEDGSTSMRGDKPRTYTGSDGEQHPIPDLVSELEQRIIEAFGLQTPESTLAWLEGLGELPPEEHRLVAIRGPELPEYYDGDMELTVEYDRGDVWYDFPFDEQGQPVPQPVRRRPRVTVYTEHLGKRVPLARFGTTIGGWRREQIEDTVMWKYKESPVGPRVWTQIVASPVWLPPETTPARAVLKRRRPRRAGEPEYEINYHETGPSYASAYGLVAAYHRKYLERRDGSMSIGQDEGIRTHGSVDYMSIMRRHSHGCHRLHNHIAVRLMSFVLAHRPHRRAGQDSLFFKRLLEHEEETYEMDIRRGGYVFELERPLKVNVLEGRIRGRLKEPLEFHVPKFDEDYGAYVTPDGGAVEVRGDQLVEVPLPIPDGGLPGLLDGGIPDLTADGLQAATEQPDGTGEATSATSGVSGLPATYDPTAPADPNSESPVFFGQ